MAMTATDKVIAFLASARVLFERVKANRKAYKTLKLAWAILLFLLSMMAYTALVTRHAADKAVEEYKAYLTEVQEKEEEAARLAAEQDPYLLQLDREATAGARALEGIRLFNYDEANKKTFLQGVANRVLNPAYPDTVEGVLAQRGQFDFYSEENPATEDNYWLCYEFFDTFHKQERLPCSSDLVFIELGNRVVLRDTLEKTYNTQTWWYGK